MVGHLLERWLFFEFIRLLVLLREETAADVGQARNHLANVPISVEEKAELVVVLTVHLLVLVE